MLLRITFSFLILLPILFSCQNGSPDMDDMYNNDKYEQDFAFLDSLDNQMLATFDTVNKYSATDLFIDSVALRQIKSDKLQFMRVSSEALQTCLNSGYLAEDDFYLDQTLILLSRDKIEEDNGSSELINQTYIRHHACDYSKLALFDRNIIFDFPKFEEHQYKIESMVSCDPRCLIVFDNWDVQLPTLMGSGTGSQFTPGFATVTITGIDLTTQKTLFRFNVQGENSNEIEVSSYYSVSDFDAEMGIDNDLFKNTIVSAMETVNTVFESKNIKKKAEYLFEPKN